MTDLRQELIQKAKTFDLDITSRQADQFQTYMEMLVEWNEKVNLTAITKPSDIVEKHFIDSLLLLKATSVPQGARMIDIGTGAGFPGIPVKILRPDIELTLLDSLNKRLLFLHELCAALDIEARILHKRAEEAAREPLHRDQYDLATARAVAAMPALVEYCLPFLKVGGVFAALKGPAAAQELAVAETAVSLLGGEMMPPASFALPCGDERTILLVHKSKRTPKQYPRHGGTIAKKPL